jgi:DNA modification methylase
VNLEIRKAGTAESTEHGARSTEHGARSTEHGARSTEHGARSTAISLPRPYHEESAVTIFHGDSAQILPLLGQFDLLLTDPKYGIGADAAAAKNRGKWGWKHYGDSNWDSERTPPWLIGMALEHCAEAIVWGGNYFTDCLPPKMGWLVWNKMQRNFSLADGELAWSSYDKALRIVDVPRAAALLDVKEHPTQKSVEVIRWCIGFAERAGGREILTVLDPFAGSGTTGVAAKELGKRAVLIEREERYCEIAARRLAQDVLPLASVPS